MKWITDQIEWSILNPIGAEDGAVRIEAVAEDQGRAFAKDSPAAVDKERCIADLHDGLREPLPRTSTRHGRPGHPLTLNESPALRGPATGGAMPAWLRSGDLQVMSFIKADFATLRPRRNLHATPRQLVEQA
jgi:hypothetical protein